MAKGKGNSGRYPRDLLRDPDVFWSFTPPAFRSRQRFEGAVRRYQRRLDVEDNWRPEEVVLRSPRVRIRPDFWDEADPPVETIELSADDGAAFTAGELLFKVHNAFLRDYQESAGDHTFFEGFVLTRQPRGDEPPLYDIALGS